jgi:hypothetical protein
MKRFYPFFIIESFRRPTAPANEAAATMAATTWYKSMLLLVLKNLVRQAHLTV